MAAYVFAPAILCSLTLASFVTADWQDWFNAGTEEEAIVPDQMYTNFTVKSSLGPIVINNYTCLGVMTLKDKQIPQCQCQSPFTKVLKVCGNDGETYPTACALANAMKLDDTLGLRCNHACPCPDSEAIVTAVGTCDDSNKLVPSKPKRKLNMKYPAKVNKVQVFCLTDGTEEVRATVFCRFAKDPELGVRAMGSCREFANFNCPARLLQTLPMFE